MKLTTHLRHLGVWTAFLSMAISSPLAFTAERRAEQGADGGKAGQDVVELGSAEFESTAKVPAAAGGNVWMRVRVTVGTSRDVVKRINEGIASGRYRAPFKDNKELVDMIVGSRPGSFEIEFLGLNKASRFYYFFEEELKKVKADPAIPRDLGRRTNELIRSAKALLYQTIKPNDYEGSKIIYEQALEGGCIAFLGSAKRDNQPVGKLTFTAKEQPIYTAMKKVLSQDKPSQRSTPVIEKGDFDDIIKAAQKKKILISKG
ncbi:MAG: hypothetical protein NTY01_17695 [Verrucomicrobia bacterium]|nr:hypothetical protein [Verrucomicrobiota bacterium]